MPRGITHNCIVATVLLVFCTCFTPAFAIDTNDIIRDDRLVLSKAEERLKTRITYSCRELSIDTVLIQLAEQAQIDIIKSPNVTGEVTVKVTDVPLEEVLNNILAAHGYTYIPTENMIRIMPLSEVVLAREKLVTRIYRIAYADVEEVVKGLTKFISRDGKIAHNRGTSNIIVTDFESKVKAIDNFIEEIDRITPQVLVEVKIYDVTSTEGFELGVDWSAGRNVDVTDITRKNEFEKIDTTVSETDIWERTITESDDPEASAPVITETEYTQKPQTTGFGIVEKETITEESTSRRSKPFITGTFDEINGGTLRLGLLNDAVDIEILLNILHSEVEAKLLANPRVLVLDNETANFKIVREIPYTEETLTIGGVLGETKFKEVGVALEVTPHITRNGMVKLHIVPEFGVVIELNEQGAPTIDTRLADTIALVQNGQTVVLGGLRKRESSLDIYKVPVLGDMPLLGGLFRSESEQVRTNELIVFITPKIIEGAVLSETEAEKLRLTGFKGSS